MMPYIVLIICAQLIDVWNPTDILDDTIFILDYMFVLIPLFLIMQRAKHDFSTRLDREAWEMHSFSVLGR